MMREELGLEEPDPKRAPRSAVTIGLSYIARGLLPLAPSAVGVSLTTAFVWSIGVTLPARCLHSALSKPVSRVYRCCAVQSDGRRWRSGRRCGLRVSTSGQPIRRVAERHGRGVRTAYASGACLRPRRRSPGRGQEPALGRGSARTLR